MTVQFVDDVLDFTGSTLQLGKPALNDLRSGLATAPVLYAAEVWASRWSAADAQPQRPQEAISVHQRLMNICREGCGVG